MEFHQNIRNIQLELETIIPKAEWENYNIWTTIFIWSKNSPFIWFSRKDFLCVDMLVLEITLVNKAGLKLRGSSASASYVPPPPGK